MTSRNTDMYDAIVVGAGPGGSVSAARMAGRGLRVLVLEKDVFPRFHIGESLLPYMAGLLDQLGMLEAARGRGFVDKRGAEFTGVDGDFQRIEFTAQGPSRQSQTFQVERAEFDSFLLDEARARGAQVLEGAQVQELLLDGDRITGVRYEHAGSTETARARFVIDASGRAGRIANRFGLRRTFDKLRKVAVYRHYDGLAEEHNPGVEGDIQIGEHPDGWLWAIPTRPGTISIGAVMSRGVLQAAESPAQAFDTHLARVPRINARLRGTRAATDLRVETDYCYWTDTVTGPGWFIVGDAGCFVDPLFSAGVYLAMTTGMAAGDAVADAIGEPGRETEVQTGYSNFYKTGYDTYFRLDLAYYEHGCTFVGYLRSLPEDTEIRWVARLLSGDFWSDTNPLAQLHRADSRLDVFPPFTRTTTCPIYPRAVDPADATWQTLRMVMQAPEDIHHRTEPVTTG